MAEPKGGPVKPPTLDLKASKSRSTPTNTDAPKPHKSGPQRTAAPNTPIGRGTTQNSNTQNSKNRSNTTPAPPSFPMTAVWGAIGGAVLALLLIIPLLLLGIVRLPASQASSEQFNELTMQLNAAQEQNAGNLASVSALESQVIILRDQLEVQNTQTSTQSEQLNQQITSLTQNQQSLTAQNTDLVTQQNEMRQALQTVQSSPVLPTFDPSGLVQNIDDLNAQIAAIGSGASPEEAQNISQSFSQMQFAIDELKEANQQIQLTQTSSTEQSNAQSVAQNEHIANLNRLANERLMLINQQAQTIERLRTTLQSHSNALQDADQAIQQLTSTTEAATITQNQIDTQQPFGLAHQTQIAIDSTRLALTNGQPFLPQLETLAAQFPEIDITSTMQESARLGLTSPSQLIQLVDTAIPDMLAARPADPNAGFLSQISNSVKSALAIRPTGLTNGDPIENMLNQAVAATNRSDFATAFELFSHLPNSMIVAMHDPNNQQNLHTQIGKFADIQTLLAQIQQQLDDTTAQTNLSGEGAS